MKNKSQDLKEIFRKEAINKLRNTQNKYLISKKINEKLKHVIQTINEKKEIKTILFYMPLSFEPNILPLIKFYKNKYTCFIPQIQEKSFDAVPFRYPLQKSPLGTKESKTSILYKKNIDLMIVPILGYDKTQRRIGFGKGMYDRFFSKLKNKPIVLFTQLKKIYSKEIITMDFDIKCNIYVSSEIKKHQATIF